ncbi:MAG: hypothetical protein C0501_07950 [Isosphaera sp.]|nr:hypothetical protein [Isosphaera sp.]
MSTATPAVRAGRRKVGHGSLSPSEIILVPLASVRPSPENDALYGAVHPDAPGFREFARGIGETVRLHGVRAVDPIVLTADNVVVSGHRRRLAFQVLGVDPVPARYLPVSSADPGHTALLARYNRQRDKTPAERVREQLALADPAAAHAALLADRAERSRVEVEPIALGDAVRRKRLSGAKAPMLAGIRRVVDDLRDYWPLTDRRVHYALLNDPPLIHASKPDSTYRNDDRGYDATKDVLTRGRLAGLIPFEAVGDETRPVAVWDAHPNVTPFVARQLDRFLKGYARDLMTGQPNHVEIVGEKMTIEGSIRPVAAEFRIPYTIGRGYSSLPPRKKMFDRYRASGKDRLVVLFLADHDPEGMDIPGVFARSMRDDFGVASIHPVRVGLNPEQVRGLGLPPNTAAKVKSSRFKAYSRAHGAAAYELEAVHPETLRLWVRNAIRSVIDLGAFDAQRAAEARDAAELSVYRAEAVAHLRQIVPGGAG